MVIYYFGADLPFKNLQQSGFKRRNAVILKTLSECRNVQQVISFNYTDRKTFLRHFFKNFAGDGQKMKDVYFTEIFVIGKFKIGFLNKLFNRVYFIFLRFKLSKQRVLSWVYWPNGFIDYKRAAAGKRFVFDADHSLLDDPNLDAHDKDELESILNEVAKKAQLIMSGSNLMLEWFKKRGNKNGYRLRNGIDLSRFSSVAKKKLDKFTVVYCGMLSNWIDYELFINVISANPNIDFVIIGRAFMNDSYSRLTEYRNVLLLGERSAEEVAEALPTFHAGLGLYKTGIIDGDSMKIYEYLAAGLPVICTNYHQTLKEDFNGLLYIGESAEDFNKIISYMKENHFAPDQLAVQDLLQQSTWQKRIEGVMEYL